MKRLLCTLFTLVIATTAFGQSRLEVSVINKNDGQVVKDLAIILENQGIGYRQIDSTNAQGKAFFGGLSTSGSYRAIAVENGSYYSLNADDIVFRSNDKKSITMALLPKETRQLEEVKVQASNAISRINTIDAEVSSELQEQDIENIPIEGRTVSNSLHRLPNVTKSTGFYSEAPKVTINGANSLYTSYLIDGMDNNERFLGGPRFRIPIGFSKNITVLANNYSAEYGQTSNGLFNVTTKSGSNKISGETYYNVRPGSVIDASSPFNQTDLSGNAVDDGFQRHQFGLGVGGPIKKDKTFFYLNAEQTIGIKDNLLNVPELGVNTTVQGRNNYSLLSGKIDHNWSGNFRSSLRLHKGFVSIDRQGGGLNGGVTFPEAANEQSRNSFTAALRNVYNGSGFTSETNYQYATFNWIFTKPNTTGVPSVNVLDPQGQTIAKLGESFGNFDILQTIHQVQQKFTFYRGKHTIKAGLDFIGSIHNDTRGGNAKGFYRVQLNQQQLNNLRSQNLGRDLSYRDIPSGVQVLSNTIELHPNTFSGSQSIYSAYIEDLYSVNNQLNLTFGLRYDYDNLSKAGADQGDFNNISPRFNLNYRLNDKSSFRAGYGLFYGRIPYTIYSDAVAGSSNAPDFKEQLRLLRQQGFLPSDTNIDRITSNGNASATETNVAYLQGSTSKDFANSDGYAFSNQKTILNPNGLDNPYSHHFTLGYQRQLREDVLFYVDLIHKRGFNKFRLADVNTPSPYEVNDPNAGPSDVRSQRVADATRRVPIRYDNQGNPFALSNGDTLRNIARRVTMTQSKGESRYWAANFNLLKSKGSSSYSYRISYTISSLRNNTEDINFEAEDANDFSDEWGPSINDRRHVLSAVGTYYPIDNLGITLTSLIQSGQPVNRIPDATQFGGTTDLNGDGSSRAVQYTGKTDRAPGATRNDKRLPWSYTFDMSLQYRISIFGNNALQLRADVFNVLNTTNYSGYTSNATVSNQIQVGLIDQDQFVYRNAAPPRQFQFSLSYKF
ncbi:TonB-dependent Receptor Plug Domain [Fodinibius salinus]|uniref:TonB-dependent Receptor Plug Domain n=1 Tax=Fodinibius salinus TaxID=860790 RepID=A0A5D3YNB4_9BACT|nr:TonB-dependent receptor [Fodinibius salinus]TYP93639.1 TonB-dependent Receptor Plug Domain [Fodinibius salinus]